MAFINPETLDSLLELVIPTAIEPPFLSGVSPGGPQQHIVEEYLEGYASLVVRTAPQSGSGEILCVTDSFLLTGLNESDSERFSMAYTLGDPVIRGGRGRRPRMYGYSGVLIDTAKDGSNISAWRVIYDKYLRGTSCIALGAVIEMRFRDQYRRGYMASCNLVYDANNPQRAGLTFTLFVIEARRADI